MSSFRRPKSEAALRLYNLPRRELQALCKQYGIPANKTNVAMADALSACIPADNAKPKASAGSFSLGVAKTTPMKLKSEKKIGLPETSLASFILTGKRKTSPVKLAVQPTEIEEGGFPKPNTTPLKRGVKRPVQGVQEEKSKVAAVPAFTRAAALQDRFGKAVSATHHGKLGESASAVSSPKPPVPTPRKRAAEVAAVVTRRGGDALPPVSFCDLVSSPKKSRVPEIIELDSSGKSASEMRTRRGHRTGSQEEEAELPLSHVGGAGNKVSKGKRVAFADEVKPQKNASSKSEPQLEPETETETLEISYAEIEFKDAAIHKELFGFQRNTTMEVEHDVAPAPKEELEIRENASDSTQEAGSKFRDMDYHQEAFGTHGNNESNSGKVVRSPLDLQQAGTSAGSFESDSPERRISNPPTSSPAKVLSNSNTVPSQDHSVLLSSSEDVCEGGSDSQGKALEELAEEYLTQDCEPSPRLDDVPCDNLVESPCEKIIDVPDHSHRTSLGCLSVEIHTATELTLEQEPSLISSTADLHQVVDEERPLGDAQPHRSENHDVLDDLGNESFEGTHVSSVPVLEEGQKAHSGTTLEFDEVRSSSEEVVEKEKLETSPRVTLAKNVVTSGPELVEKGIAETSPSVPSAKSVVTAGLELVMSTPYIPNVSMTPTTNAQENTSKRLSSLGNSSISATPVANAQDQSTKRLSGLRSFDVPVTPAAIVQEYSSKRLSVPSSSDIPITPVTKLQELQENSHSVLAKAATPLSIIQSNIDSTLAKATSILHKLAAWRADAEKKSREGYWEPKFSTVVDSASAAPGVENPIAKTVLPVDTDVSSAKKARPAPKSVLGPEKGLIVCEDTDIVAKGDMPSAKKMRISDESRDLSGLSDKENQSDKSIDSDKSFRKMGGIGKDKKRGKKFEVLKDRSKNLPDHGSSLSSIKESTGLVRPGDMSLRKLRAQVKQKVSQLEAAKASPLRSQKGWNTSH